MRNGDERESISGLNRSLIDRHHLRKHQATRPDGDRRVTPKRRLRPPRADEAVGSPIAPVIGRVHQANLVFMNFDMVTENLEVDPKRFVFLRCG